MYINVDVCVNIFISEDVSSLNDSVSPSPPSVPVTIHSIIVCHRLLQVFLVYVSTEWFWFRLSVCEVHVREEVREETIFFFGGVRVLNSVMVMVVTWDGDGGMEMTTVWRMMRTRTRFWNRTMGRDRQRRDTPHPPDPPEPDEKGESRGSKMSR
jgi:hypothetical protein